MKSKLKNFSENRLTKAQLLTLIKSDLKESGVKLVLKKNMPGMSGYFDHINKELVYINNKEGTGTLIHEYCHFLQWRSNSPIYDSYMPEVNNFAEAVIESLKNGKRYKKRIINEALTITLDCEVDCEKLAINLIEKYKIRINIDYYTRIANSVLVSYLIDTEHAPEQALGKIYDIRNVELVRMMPNKLMSTKSVKSFYRINKAFVLSFLK